VVHPLRTFFKSNAYTAVRLLAGVITLLILVGYQYIPPRTVNLLPDSEYPYFQYVGDGDTQAVSGNDRKFSCDFKQTQVFSCGLSLSLGKDGISGLNLEDFDGLIINAKYTGTSNRFRITVRNFNSAYSNGDPSSTAKNQLTFIRASDFNKPTLIKLSEFSVAEWWIRQFDIPREHSAPEFSNVVSIGFDFVDNGQQELEIQKVELVGAWFSKETLYLTVLLLWLCLIIGEGVIRFAWFYIDSKRANQKIDEMAESYRKLEVEKQEFEVLSTTDKLTGIINRNGIDKFVKKVFQSNYEKSQLGVILFDIDHFKKINDTYGHDVGDRVLQGLAKLISANIREVDAFGRWGGEEFIIIAPQAKQENLKYLAEKLRSCVQLHTFEPDLPLQVTISLGISMVQAGDSFDSTLKKADMALYVAKNRGRNCVASNLDY
jgi:diguanylate cyclase (GGDEF)-like protein